MRRALIVGAGVALLFAVGLPAQATSAVRVGCSVAALRAAITTANGAPGTILKLRPHCTYTMTDTSSSAGDGLPAIAASMTIRGNGARLVRSASAPQFRILELEPGVVVSISSLSIRGGHAPDSSVATGASGGGILNRGALRLSNVTVSHNVAGAGGSPIGLLPGAGGNGGGIDNLGSLTLVGSSIVKNRTGGGGVSAGINAPSGNGGGVYMASSASATIIKRSVIKKNVAAPATGLIGGAGDGGGIFNASSATIVPRATRIVRNSPDNCAPAGTVSRCRH